MITPHRDVLGRMTKTELVDMVLDRASRLVAARARLRDLEGAVDDANERARCAVDNNAARWREAMALLSRARELLIHEKVDAQLHGRDAYYTGGGRPGGWRLNGVGDLASTIEAFIRGGP